MVVACMEISSVQKEKMNFMKWNMGDLVAAKINAFYEAFRSHKNDQLHNCRSFYCTCTCNTIVLSVINFTHTS